MKQPMKMKNAIIPTPFCVALIRIKTAKPQTSPAKNEKPDSL